MTTPRTAEGRALLAADEYHAWECFGGHPCGCGLDDHVAVIEAAAVSDFAKRLTERVEGLPTDELIDSYGETDGMCPNCLAPWKCNGPHEPPPTKGTTWLAVDRAAVLRLIEEEADRG